MRKRWHSFIHGPNNEAASGKTNTQAGPAGSGSVTDSSTHKGASASRPTSSASKKRSNSSSFFRQPAWRHKFSSKLEKMTVVERAPLPPSPIGLVTMTPAVRQWRTDYVEPRYRTAADDAGQKTRKAQRAERMFRAMDEYTRQKEERERRERREQEEWERQERLDAMLAVIMPAPGATSRKSSFQTQASTPKTASRRGSYGEDDSIDDAYHRRRLEGGLRISRMPTGPKAIIVKPIERLPNPIEWGWHKQNHPK